MSTQFFYAEAEGPTLRIGETSAGRVSAAAARFVLATLGVAAAAAIVSLPDYLGRYREQEPSAGFFPLLVLGVAGFIGLVLGVLRLMRRDLWIVDADEGLLVFESHRIGGRTIQNGVDLADVVGFRYEPALPPQAGQLTVDLSVADGASERIITTRRGPEALRPAAERLQAFLDEHDLGLRVEGL